VRFAPNILGLLRHLKIPADAAFQGAFVNAKIQLRFLPEGDIEELKRECSRFRPSVLHFICHGEADAAGGASRIVLRRRPDGAPGGALVTHSVSADELVDQLTENGGWLPPAIVLNACYAGGTPYRPAPIDDTHLPFAAQLVRRGAAISVGMAGEVADRACRMFTLRLRARRC
jgi:hypothetical protein